MKEIKIWNDSISQAQLDETVDIIKSGGIIIWKTDTRYAFACDALNKKSLERICGLKHINPDKSRLSIVFGSISRAAEFVRIEDNMFRLLKDNIPGPFTFIFKTGSSLPKSFKERKEAGIRFPDSETVIKIVEKLENPMMTASLPDEDPDYAVNPDLIKERYSHTVDLMLDFGEGTMEESTVVDCTTDVPEITKQGKGELHI